MAARIHLDIDFLSHPKILQLDPLTELLFIRAILYAARHLTDGFIPHNALGLLTHNFDDRAYLSSWTSENSRTPLDLADELVDAKLFHVCRGGWKIHDYLEYQLSKREVQQLVEDRRKAGQAGGRASAQAKAQANLKQTSSKIKPIPLSLSVPLSGMKEEETNNVGLAPNGYHVAEGLLSFLNERTGKKFQARTPKGHPTKNLLLLSHLLKQQYSETQIRQVIANRWLKWGQDPKMQEFLRPSTLFRPSNFENYLGELGVTHAV